MQDPKTPIVTQPITPEPARTPINRTKKNQRRRKQALDETEKKVAQIAKYLSENMDKFGIDEYGSLLDHNRIPIDNSSYIESVKRIVYPTLGGFTPPGTKRLHNKIAKDDYLKTLLSSKFNPQSWK